MLHFTFTRWTGKDPAPRQACYMLATALRHQSHNALPAWQRVLALAFAFLFACVLPFICWGTWAQPCHPHSRPHFVFLEPVHTVTTHGGVHCTPATSAGHNQAAGHDHATNPTTTNPLSGQALPDVTLALFLLIAYVGAGIDVFRTHTETRRLVGLLLLLQPSLCVPTPPPRPV